MDSYRSYYKSNNLGQKWVEGADQDIYEVESRVPLPRPFSLPSSLNEKNAIVVQTQISHIIHKKNGHLLKVVSKISLPTPPYTVSDLYCLLFLLTKMVTALVMRSDFCSRVVTFAAVGIRGK